MTWDVCPGEFKARYVDGRPFVLTEALAFGQAVHIGLEAHFRGDDGERAFRAAWKQHTLELRVSRDLVGVGLELVDKVVALELRGTPERAFEIKTELVLGAPIVGAVDLWGDGVIFDFKTTRGRWSAERAQSELWQPVLYSWAYHEETGEFPAFEYVVLNRVTGALDRFRRQWTLEQWGEQWASAYDRMREIARLTAASDFQCRGQHGYCPECGERWAHDHVCDETSMSRRIRL